MAEFSRIVKVTKKELKAALKDPGEAALLTQRYRENVSDPIKNSVLITKDLSDYQEKRKALKRKAEAVPWTPSKPEPWKYKPRDEFSGGLGRMAKSGS